MPGIRFLPGGRLHCEGSLGMKSRSGLDFCVGDLFALALFYSSLQARGGWGRRRYQAAGDDRGLFRMESFDIYLLFSSLAGAVVGLRP
jgi:hypothetical protein